jgi:hypothetical protein
VTQVAFGVILTPLIIALVSSISDQFSKTFLLLKQDSLSELSIQYILEIRPTVHLVAQWT